MISFAVDDLGYKRLDRIDSDDSYLIEDEYGFIRLDARAGMTLCTPGRTVPCGNVCRQPRNCAKGKSGTERTNRIGAEALKEHLAARQAMRKAKPEPVQKTIAPQPKKSEQQAQPLAQGKKKVPKKSATSKPIATEEEKNSTVSDRGKLVKNSLNVSDQEAEAIADAVVDFTVEAYKPIRAAQSGGKYTPPPPKEEALKKAEMIERYIASAPKHQGEIYRGLNFTSKDQLDKFIADTKDGIEMNAMSSFTADSKIASRFAQGAELDKPGEYPVVLVVRSNKSGTKVSDFSEFPEEAEVLVPSKTKYRIAETRQKGKAMALVLEEI